MGKYTAEPKTRPSRIGHFFARIGSIKHRSKSPRDPSLKLSDDGVTPCPTQPTSPNYSIKNKENRRANEMDAENEFHISSPPKPKQHSSPFSRIIHRLSMNRKSREASSVHGSVHNFSQTGWNEVTSSHETVSSASTLPTISGAGDILSRPTVSENDLRFLTLRKGEAIERSVTALSMNRSDVQSSENFNVVTRVPSYLRISCALNGYHRPYRHIDETCRRENSIPRKLPMSIVESRKLAFSQSGGNDNLKSMTSEEVMNRNNSQMGDNISRTSAPVRQLVEQFDHILENNSNGKMKGGTENSFHDENRGVLDEVHDSKPLDHPVTPQNSLAVSSQLCDAAYWHGNPKPSVAQQMHQAVRKTSEESEPRIGNQSKINIEIEHLTNEQVAEVVKNENRVNFILPDGEAYRSLLMEARTTLQLLCDEAKNDLLNEEVMPEHAAGTLRTAIGKANLLLDKKMTKFEDLVKNHLDQNSNVQQVKLSDLSGYWALISIELKELEAIFREVSFLRENHWIHPDSEFSAVSTVGENRADAIKKVLPHLPVINSEKVAFEVQRRQTALAAAKRRQKELKKAEEEQYVERNCYGGTRMVI